jgi:hypothetical protein
MTNTRTPLQTYLDALDAAYNQHRILHEALVANFDKTIETLYGDPMVRPYTMRCTEVDRLVSEYHIERGRLIVQRDAKVRAAAELYLKTMEPTR